MQRNSDQAATSARIADQFHFDLLWSPCESLHRYPALVVLVLAITGILLDRATFWSLPTSLVRWGCLVLAVIVVVEVTRRHIARPSARQTLRYLASAIGVIGLFATWHAFLEQQYRSASILKLLDREAYPVIVQGTLDGRVVLRSRPGFGNQAMTYTSELMIDVDRYRNSEQLVSIDGRVLVRVDGDLSHHRPGDRLEIYGWLRPFDQPTNPGEPDLRSNYRRRGLHCRIDTKNAQSVVLLSPSRDIINRTIASIGDIGRDSLIRYTGSQTGPLALALVLGQRELVDQTTRDQLLTTGTAHLLSVSGMHLAILVMFVSWAVAAAGINPTPRFIVIVSLSAFYVAMTGGRPPVLRAAVLVGVFLLAGCFRRTSQPLNTLAFAAILLLVKNPLNLFAPGVHLSFLAVITLMLAARSAMTLPLSFAKQRENQRQENFDRLIENSAGLWKKTIKLIFGFVGQLAWMSTCVTAVALPYVWAQFHLISLISVLTNVLVWMGLAFALPAGVIVVILDPIAPWLATMPAAVCEYSLRYMSTVIAWAASIPGGHYWLPSPTSISIGAFYVGLAMTLFVKLRWGRVCRFAWIGFWVAVNVVLVTRVSPFPESMIETTFIDVGHGTSVIVRTADRRIWLYDCGRLGNYEGNCRPIDTALWSMGITQLDGVFLSHADADHYNALPALLERFKVKQIITPPGMLRRSEKQLRDLDNAIDNAAVPVVEVCSDQTISERNALVDCFEVLHPPLSGVHGSDNANSLVLKLVHAGVPVILPGDLEPPGTELLVDGSRPPPGGIMMAPHHGSLRMKAEMVLAWARPQETIVSGGKRSRSVEVQQMLSQTGSGVHVTAKLGAVRVRLDRNANTEIRSWLCDPW
ncbi:ComEC/Rec2 family competence protein [Stieleria sp. JC731]|uniref:ComEC/Rec2 family competence protein n=1 Tax=Pirellulaceae TaxID=2691357 RepID=UPI001E305180|nr:ComEC/Rec2 family competence protein [Stieleria sp. JC731]MCC9600877.1 ComEC/Rec2 family competence protein [Stieleria sp. JC731]